jgi:hypothetical protein
MDAEHQPFFQPFLQIHTRRGFYPPDQFRSRDHAVTQEGLHESEILFAPCGQLAERQSVRLQTPADGACRVFIGNRDQTLLPTGRECGRIGRNAIRPIAEGDVEL